MFIQIYVKFIMIHGIIRLKLFFLRCLAKSRCRFYLVDNNIEQCLKNIVIVELLLAFCFRCWLALAALSLPPVAPVSCWRSSHSDTRTVPTNTHTHGGTFADCLLVVVARICEILPINMHDSRIFVVSVELQKLLFALADYLKLQMHTHFATLTRLRYA